MSNGAGGRPPAAVNDDAEDQPPAGSRGNGGRRLVEAFSLAWAAAPWSVLVVGVTALAQGIVPVAIAWFTKLLLDDVAAPGAGTPWGVVTGLVASVALLTVLPHTAEYFQAELRRGVELTVQTRLFAAVNRVPGLGPFERQAFHDRLQFAEQAGQTVPGQIVQSATALAQAVVTQLGLISALAVVDWRIAAVALAVGLPALPAELHVSRARNALVWSLSPVRRQAMHYVMLQGDVQAAKEIRIFGLAGFLADRMAALIRRAHRDEHRLDGRELRVQTGLGAIAAATLAVGLIVAVGAAAGGRIGVGDLALTLVALPAIQAGVGGIVRNVGLAHSALLLFDHYRAMVGEPVPPPGAAPPPLTAGIELRDVWFRYDADQPWVLRGVDLDHPRTAGPWRWSGSTAPARSHHRQAAVPALRPDPRGRAVGRRRHAGPSATPSCATDRRGVPGLHGVRPDRRGEHRARRPGPARRPRSAIRRAAQATPACTRPSRPCRRATTPC